MLHTKMDKDCKHIKPQQLCHKAVALNAATLHEERFVPGPLTGKSVVSDLIKEWGLYERIRNKRNTK